MTFLLKDPDAALDYGVDWASDYLNGASLLDSSWAVSPDEDSGLRIVATNLGPSSATATVEGGVPGHVYQLTNHVLLTSGLTDSRSIVLRVERR